MRIYLIQQPKGQREEREENKRALKNDKRQQFDGKNVELGHTSGKQIYKPKISLVLELCTNNFPIEGIPLFTPPVRLPCPEVGYRKISQQRACRQHRH
jgi:hypothetical protein